MTTLKITEIYESIQGEGRFSGWPCIFVRLAGCPLRCRWCDTVYSFGEGDKVNEREFFEKIATYSARHVEFTGGEPLAQPYAAELMKKLVEQGYVVMIETGGSIDVSDLDQRVHIIMDLKCPDSGMADRNLYDNIAHLKSTDEIKFVIASKSDFDWAVETCNKFSLYGKVGVLFSAAFGLVKEKVLIEWILAAGIPVKFNMQIHKYIWSPREKGV